MDKVVSGALETWDNFKTGLADKVNAVTGGINVVLDFFSIPKIPEWKPNTPNSTKTSMVALLAQDLVVHHTVVKL